MKIDAKIKKVIVFATLLMSVGVFLIVYSSINDYKKVIETAIKEKQVEGDFAGGRTAVYLISDINKSCRPCSKFEDFKKEKDLSIIFYVPTYYSQYDIENLRDAFNIPPKYKVEQIHGGWRKLFKQYNEGRDIIHNLLILIDKKQTVSGMWRF